MTLMEGFECRLIIISPFGGLMGERDELISDSSQRRNHYHHGRSSVLHDLSDLLNGLRCGHRRTTKLEYFHGLSE